MIIGIVGKPNVGKSAFFRAVTLAQAESGNFPFTTINPNSAVGYVKVKDPAQEFNKVSNPREGYVIDEYRFVPVELIDVAGLVPGAYEGKGLGNKFLDDLRQADVLVHIIDLSGSTNDKGEPIEFNSYDPANDILFLEEELNQWYFTILKRNFESVFKKIKMQGQKIEEAFHAVLSGLKISEKQISLAILDLSLDVSNLEENLFQLAVRLREISKPMIIGANKCDVLQEGKLWEEKLKKLQEQFPHYMIIPTCAQYEFNLKKATESKMVSYCPGENSYTISDEGSLNENQKTGLETIQNCLDSMKSTGVQECLDFAVFKLLEMKPIFPGGAKLEDDKGNVLPDCFLMQKNATALDFAYKLHTDFGKNFVQAINIKKKIPIGKDQVLEFGDIVEIRAGR